MDASNDDVVDGQVDRERGSEVDLEERKVKSFQVQ